MNVAGHDADFAFAGGDDAGTIWSNEARGAFGHGGLDSHHINHRDAFGDADDELDAGVNRFEDRVRSTSWWNENHRGVATGFAARFHDGVKDGNLIFENLTTACGRDARNDIGAVFHTGLRVGCSRLASDALNEQARIFINEDGHGEKLGCGGDDFLSGVGDVGCGCEFETGFGKELAAGFDVGAFQAHHERHWEVDGFHGIDDALSDDVALHDAAENIHQNGFHSLVRDKDLECLGDLLLGGSTSYVEEVGGFAAVVFNDIHRRHRESGSIHQAGDISIQPDVAEIVLRGFDLAGVFLFNVAVGLDIRVAEEGVVVEIEFRIQGAHVATLGDDERVHFDHRAIRGDECFVEVRKKHARTLHLRGWDT